MDNTSVVVSVLVIVVVVPVCRSSLQPWTMVQRWPLRKRSRFVNGAMKMVEALMISFSICWLNLNVIPDQ